MSVETPQPLPLSERMKRCPIHAVVDVEAVLHVSKVLSIYVPYMHEVLVIRGEYPLYPDPEQLDTCRHRIEVVDKRYRPSKQILATKLDPVFNHILVMWGARTIRLN